MSQTSKNQTMIFHFKPNILPGAFTFYFGPYDEDEIRAAYEAAGFEDLNRQLYRPAPHLAGMASYPEPAAPVLWMERTPHSPVEIGTLVHELSHIVLRYLDDVGMRHDDHTTEVFSYLMDALTSAVLERVWHGNLRDGTYDIKQSKIE